jgi:ATPase subunit of ABC transporter with duplicated ATPase domains
VGAAGRGTASGWVLTLTVTRGEVTQLRCARNAGNRTFVSQNRCVRVSCLSVQNYSRLADLDIEVRKHLVLVGPNDVGKSSLLRCLNLLLGASTAQLYSWLVPQDLRNLDQPLIIEADLEEFDANQEALFPDCMTEERRCPSLALAWARS